MKPPLSESLVIRDDGKLYLLSVDLLLHPVQRLRKDRLHPNHPDYVFFSIW